MIHDIGSQVEVHRAVELRYLPESPAGVENVRLRERTA